MAGLPVCPCLYTLESLDGCFSYVFLTVLTSSIEHSLYLPLHCIITFILIFWKFRIHNKKRAKCVGHEAEAGLISNQNIC